jgi:hypothetical protein
MKVALRILKSANRICGRVLFLPFNFCMQGISFSFAIETSLGISALGENDRLKMRFNVRESSLTISVATLCSSSSLIISLGVKLDVFALLEKAGINTSGREMIYKAVDKFYEFSPEFLGNGIGFLTYQLSTNMNIGVSAVHNDFLQYFIDLGFWGYILWLASMTVVRVAWFGSRGRTDNGITVLALTVYLVIVSSTDNTMNYPLLTTVLANIMIGQGFDESVQVTEEKLFGYVSEPNRKTEGDLIL